MCEVDGEAQAAGVTGLNCAGFGSAMVVTATFGMVAAGHVLRQLAAGATLPALLRATREAQVGCEVTR